MTIPLTDPWVYGSSSNMSALEDKSEAFDLRRNGEMVVVAKQRKNVVNGIVTGIIVDLMAFPLFSGALILGIWMIVAALTDRHGIHFAPQFDHFASPAIVRGADVVFPVLMGIMFAGSAFFLLRLFLKLQANFFPFECRFKRDADVGWMVQQKLWFVASRWRRLGRDWRIWCYPIYLRGEWGYVFFIRSGKAMLRLASSGAFADTKSRAETEARKDLDKLCALFGVLGESKRWM
jgi:hypothetical protein